MIKPDIRLDGRKNSSSTTYISQTGRPNAGKDAFWQLVDTKACKVPTEDYYILSLQVILVVAWWKGQTATGQKKCRERIVDFAICGYPRPYTC